jgi:heme O synthase-like polyprenyltransferase
MEMATKEKYPPDIKKHENSNVLLAFTITCLTLSIIPFVFLIPTITYGVLVLDIICLLLAIALLAQTRKLGEDSRTKNVISFVLSICAIVTASAYIILVPIISNGLNSAACSLQTVVDPSECPSDYKLHSGQELIKN